MHVLNVSSHAPVRAGFVLVSFSSANCITARNEKKFISQKNRKGFFIEKTILSTEAEAFVRNKEKRMGLYLYGVKLKSKAQIG
jgi:hypothetical protein